MDANELGPKTFHGYCQHGDHRLKFWGKNRSVESIRPVCDVNVSAIESQSASIMLKQPRQDVLDSRSNVFHFVARCDATI